MTVALSNAVRKAWFAYTNNEKGQNLARADRMERKITSYCQDVGVAGDLVSVAKDSTRGAQCFNSLAATAVNPILCVASLSRALSEEDKKSAMIQESGAMLGMFLFEGVTKQALGLTKDTGLWSKFCAKIAAPLTKAVKSTGFIAKLPNNKYTAILKGLTFIAASCTGFALGKSFGKSITKNTTEKDFQMKKLLLEQQQLAKLTAPQDGMKANAVA